MVSIEPTVARTPAEIGGGGDARLSDRFLHRNAGLERVVSRHPGSGRSLRRSASSSACSIPSRSVGSRCRTIPRFGPLAPGKQRTDPQTGERGVSFAGIVELPAKKSGRRDGRSHTQSPCVQSYFSPGVRRVIPPRPRNSRWRSSTQCSATSCRRTRSTAPDTTVETTKPTSVTGAIAGRSRPSTPTLPASRAPFRSATAPGSAT